MVKLVTKETLLQEAIENRKRRVEAGSHPEKDRLLRELDNNLIPEWKFPNGFDIREHIKEPSREDRQRGVLAELVSTGNFGAEWTQRERYEIYAGRDMEPELWRPIYVETVNSSLPKVIPVHRLGPGGVVFTEIAEGGEVKFAEILSSDFTVTLKDYAVGLKYTKELVKYNQLWNVGIFQRQAGIAYNAIQNHLHFYPILNGSYSTSGGIGTRTETSASSLGDNLYQKYVNTVGDAVDQAEARNIYGPYVILTGKSNARAAATAMMITIQDGNPNKFPVTDQVNEIIGYNSWTGEMLGETTTYDGVTDNVGYLIGLGTRADDFQSYQNQGLEETTGNPDVSRRIMEQTILDWDRALYMAPDAVQKINWPTS